MSITLNEFGMAVPSFGGGSSSGTGDMLVSVYDTNGDGKVDAADEADDALNVGGKTAAQVATAVNNSHTHSNKSTLDKLGESSGKLTFNGSEVGGGTADSVAWDNVTGKPSTFPPASHNHEISDVNGLQSALDAKGTVKSVNGVEPDSSGNVTIETGGGGTVDESRLLPALDTVPESRAGNPVVFDYRSVVDEDTLCLLHLDDISWSDATGKNTVTQNGSVATLSANGYFDNALDLSANLNSGSLSWLTIPWLAEYENSTWTMEFFAKPTKAVMNFTFFSFGNSEGSYFALGSQMLRNLWIGNGYSAYSGLINMQLNTWYWFVLQYDGAAVKVYVDGTLIVEGNFEPNYIGQDLQFGNLNLVEDPNNTFIGYLDEFRWSKGLRYPTGVMTVPTEPYVTLVKSYKVSEESLVFSDSTRLLPENPVNGDIPCFAATSTGGEWGKLNKSLLAQKSDVLPEWHQLSDSSEITLDRANGELQKVTLTQNCTLTAPTLSAANPTLLLQVTSSSAVTVTIGETDIVTAHTGTFQVGWFYDGETTRRYPLVEVA